MGISKSGKQENKAMGEPTGLIAAVQGPTRHHRRMLR
jgi:hypothetical protein